MIPSLVESEIRRALIDYLTTTFALSDDDVREGLSAFLQHEADGIFRGPFVRVRTPFQAVDPQWEPPLDWFPDGFHPYIHQARAFERLSSANGHEPEPTIITTGTGSGKTEGFLYPILDHCARARAEGEAGIKALILYPMNALATDQAGRIAEVIGSEAALAGVTAGLYIGDNGTHTQMGPDHIVDKREILQVEPPDILLTNYKMLDFLLLRRVDRELWLEPSLRYLVLDEFHTYDGAQGTDVAMLLRRLGQTLGVADDTSPLGRVTPVATSATLGAEGDTSSVLREFAGKVFGRPFSDDSVIGETRQSVDDACGPVDYSLPIPDPIDVVGLPDDDLEATAAAFCVPLDEAGEPERAVPVDPIEMGEVLLAHPLTRGVLAAVGVRSRSLSETVDEVVTRAPEWGRAAIRDPEKVQEALGRFLWLISRARRRTGEHFRPLFAVEVQLWVREISRVLRTVQAEPEFRWRDSAAVMDDAEAGRTETLELPAVYCRRCGMSGWMAVASELGSTLITTPATIYAASLARAATQRVLLRCRDSEAGARHLHPQARTVSPDATEATVPVLVTESEDDARRSTCPACRERDAIRFLGLQIASLASVSISTLFGSDSVDSEERKLLAFTDSVQDASHRAAFFAGRTHRFNLRNRMVQAIAASGSLALADLGDVLYADAHTPDDWYGLVPPDLLQHPRVRTVWTDEPDEEGREILRKRLGFEAELEFGLRSRVGRTLELSASAAAMVDMRDLEALADLVAEDIAVQIEDALESALLGTRDFLRGLLERLRLQGAIFHPFLDPYVDDGGRLWHIWGGRPDGLPPFTPGQGRPTFATTASKGDFDSLTALSATPTWFVDWTQRALGLEGDDKTLTKRRGEARLIAERTMSLLAHETDAVVEVSSRSGRVFGLDSHAIRVDDVPDDDGGPAASLLVCDTCGHRHAVPPSEIDGWQGMTCLRYRCPGHFVVAVPEPSTYYRRLYRREGTRRVVTGEHTGLLGREARESLEAAFKAGTAPDDPNVITATPTLELGIDIGDLSAVMLTSVPPSPASYVQRVGRAGRRSGNALVTTFAGGRPRDLYYLAEPEAMIAGDIRPPNCYLDAVETLQRQYVAFLLDRVATDLDAPQVPRTISDLAKTGLDDGGVLRHILNLSTTDDAQISTFLALFGEHLDDGTVEHLRDFAALGIEGYVKAAVDTWQAEYRELGLRRDRLNNAIKRIEEQPHLSSDDEDDLADLRGQRSVIARLLGETRSAYALSELERLGALPNYTLVDDTARLEATTWSRRDDGEYDISKAEYRRSARLAVKEFAPGNSFYVAGHRHVVDALEVGTVDQPLTETWRLCPACGFGTVEDEGEFGAKQIPHCPQCGDTRIADMGTRHTLLALRTALSSSSEEGARVYDQRDERDRENYNVVTTVEVEEPHISGAWQLVDRAFGAELARRTHLRTLNLGFTDRSGDQVALAGDVHNMTRFTVCMHCGAARDARDDRDGERPERLHQGWCKVRSGAVAEKWQRIVLYHQLTTEAVRLLLPVSLFEIDERLASFKAALMLGLRESFGGEPDHLDITRSELPNRDGQGDYHFLVLYDKVPGGTGYLGRLADPARMKEILEAGRTVIARCPCGGEGRAACHRCLLGVVESHEYEMVSRRLALDLLDDLLDNWEYDDEIATVARISISKLEESELERRFKVSLQDWAARTDGVTLLPAAGEGRYDAFDLRIAVGEQTLRYRIEEQPGISTTPSTIPDFRISRVDEPGRDVLIYLDGFQFHASEEHNNLAQDAAKRAGVRSEGHLVWNLTWADVESFHKAVLSETHNAPAPVPLLVGKARSAAQTVHQQRDGALDFATAHENPMQQLLSYLETPDGAAWQRLALSAVAGAAADAADGPRPVAAESLDEIVAACARGEEPNWSVLDASDSQDDPVALGVSTSTRHELPIRALLEAADGGRRERWSAFSVIPDADDDVRADEHESRWRDWLQWANLLQFLGSSDSEQTAWIAATSEVDAGRLEDLWIRTLASQGAGAEPTAVGITPEIEEELELVLDSDARELARVACERGAPLFEAGYEIDGQPVEVAWSAARIGIAATGETLETPGWKIRPAAEWGTDELVDAVTDVKG